VSSAPSTSSAPPDQPATRPETLAETLGLILLVALVVALVAPIAPFAIALGALGAWWEQRHWRRWLREHDGLTVVAFTSRRNTEGVVRSHVLPDLPPDTAQVFFDGGSLRCDDDRVPREILLRLVRAWPPRSYPMLACVRDGQVRWSSLKPQLAAAREVPRLLGPLARRQLESLGR
jgi:hypothetical protein